MGTKKLQSEERDEIARLSSKGLAVREIARSTGQFKTYYQENPGTAILELAKVYKKSHLV